MRDTKPVKQYDLGVGDKVVLTTTNTSDITTMLYNGMDLRNQGVWSISGITFKGNLYGKFHWNTSQKYWYYEEDKDEKNNNLMER